MIFAFSEKAQSGNFYCQIDILTKVFDKCFFSKELFFVERVRRDIQN